MKRPVVRRLALPVDDAPRRQCPPPPTPADQLRTSALLQHQEHVASLLHFMSELSDCVAALLRGVAQARLGLEAVTRPGDGLDETRRAPLVTELHPELADVTIDDVALDLEFTTPDAREKVFSAPRPSGVRGEEIEKC